MTKSRRAQFRFGPLILTAIFAIGVPAPAGSQSAQAQQAQTESGESILQLLEGEWLMEETGETLEIAAGVWRHPGRGAARIRKANDAADIRVFYEEHAVACAYRVSFSDRGGGLQLVPADTTQDSDYCPSGNLKRVGAVAQIKAGGPGVRLERIEVIQALQNIPHTVPLIAHKPAWVRAYFSASGAQPLAIVAALKASHDKGGEAVTIASEEPATIAPGASLRSQREDWLQSVNFPVPEKFTREGVASFAISGVTGKSDGAPIACQKCDSVRKARFVAAPPLRIKVIGLNYMSGTPPVLHAPRPIDFQLFLSWVSRAYPVAQVVSSTLSTQAIAPWPFTCTQANAQLASIRAADMAAGGDRRTHYYGMVSNGGGFMRGCASGVPQTPKPATVASGPAGPLTGPRPKNSVGTTGPTFGDWYGGHELSHTFGRRHPGFCDGNSADDASFPYPNGQLSNNEGDVLGLDRGDKAFSVQLAVLGGATHFDIMTYCNQPQWPSDYNYRGILTRIMEENALKERADGVAQGSFIHVTATVNVTAKTGKIEFVTPSQNVAEPPPAGGEAELRLTDDTGAVLARHPVALLESTDIAPGESQTAIVDAAIPLAPSATRLQLVYGGKTIDEFRSSQSAPAAPAGLALAVPSDSQPASAAGRVLAWRGASSKDRITYIVQMSADGVSWETVGVGLPDPSLALGRDQAGKGYVRVIATNGFRASPPTVMTLKK